jgi:hypothetical protein
MGSLPNLRGSRLRNTTPRLTLSATRRKTMAGAFGMFQKLTRKQCFVFRAEPNQQSAVFPCDQLASNRMSRRLGSIRNSGMTILAIG